MAPIDRIEAALESLKLADSINYTKTAEEFGVDRTTLSKRHRGVQGSREAQKEKERALNTTQASQLIKYIKMLSDRGLPPTHEMVRNFASEIAGERVGRNWVYRFLERHHNKIFSKYSTTIDRCRFQADSVAKYTLYFNLLAQKIKQYNIEPRQIYNMDEKGFLIGLLSKQKRVFSKASYERSGGQGAIQDGNREWITVLACVCADGEAIPPSLIYQSVAGHVLDTWLQDFDPDEHDVHLTSSPSGWTSNDYGLSWLDEVFQRYTAAKARRAYRLLIVDGHGSHLTMKFIEYCDAHRILLAVLPPHSTHTLQPADVGLFGPLATAYRAALQEFLYKSLGLTAITKRDFFRLFWVAWCESFTEKNIKSAFKATGIAPLDAEVVVKRFRKKDDSRPTSSSSIVSLSSRSKVATIERLIYNLKRHPFGYEARVLTKAVVNLAAENLLLHQRADGLEEALVNERKRRQRGKPLPLQPPEDYYGGAVFYSPNKVKQARLAAEQKQLNEALAQQQKDEAAKVRSEQKLLKQQEADLKRQVKLQAREAKAIEIAQKKAERQAAKEAKAVEKQLNMDIQLSKKSQSKASKAQSKPQAKMAKVIDDRVREEPSDAPVVSSRSGRPIKRPAKFR